MERKSYMDHLRLCLIGLLVPYHVAMAYNCWQENNYILLGSNQILSSLIVCISPWFMGIFFLLAGISASYALQKRTIKAFILERLYKLGVPLVFGTIFLVPILTYISNITNCFFTGTYFQHLRIFFTKWTDLSGFDGGFTIAHLWFLLYLLVISLVALCVHPITKNNIGTGKKRLGVVILLIYGSSLLLPIKLGGKSILTYFLLYCIGQYILKDASVMDQLVEQKRYWIFVVLWIFFSFANVYLFIWKGYQGEMILNIINSLASGSGILAMLCLFYVCFDKKKTGMQFLSSLSFPFYIVHFIFVVLFEYALSRIMTNVFLLFMLSTILSLLTSFATAIFIQSCPIIRLFFGYKKKKKQQVIQ